MQLENGVRLYNRFVIYDIYRQANQIFQFLTQVKHFM